MTPEELQLQQGADMHDKISDLVVSSEHLLQATGDMEDGIQTLNNAVDNLLVQGSDIKDEHIAQADKNAQEIIQAIYAIPKVEIPEAKFPEIKIPEFPSEIKVSNQIDTKSLEDKISAVEKAIKERKDKEVDLDPVVKLLREIRDKEDSEISIPDLSGKIDELIDIIKAGQIIEVNEESKEKDYTKKFDEIIDGLEAIGRLKISGGFGGGASSVEIKNRAQVQINPATSEKQDTGNASLAEIATYTSQSVMAATNALSATAYDIDAAAYSGITALPNDFELNHLAINFTTALAKTITITDSDGTILWGGSVDTSAANEGYNTTAQHFYLTKEDIGGVFNGGDNITVAVTATTGACLMDLKLVTESGSNTLLGDPAVNFLDPSGTAYGIKHASNKPRVSATPYLYDVVEGNITGHTAFRLFGYNSDIDDVREDLWEVGGTYVPPTTPIQMRLVSTSASDTTAGTGARTVDIHYLDTNYVEQEETVTLNGTTPVNTVATNILRVNDMHVMTDGSNGVPVGNISLTNLASTVTYSYIVAGLNASRQAFRTVPAGKNLFLTQWNWSSGSSTGGHYMEFLLRANTTIDNELVTVFHIRDIAASQDNGDSRTLGVPIKILATSDVKISAISDAPNSNVKCNAGFEGWLETI